LRHPDHHAEAQAGIVCPRASHASGRSSGPIPKKYGIESMRVAGGMGQAMLIERLI
jgi:hypothetical protein